MKQKILQKLMLIAVLLTGITAHASDFSALNSDGVRIYYNITSSTDKATVSVTYSGKYSYSGTGYAGTVKIPETVTYKGIYYSVTGIGNDAFFADEDLTNVIIPNSVTGISYDAFKDCSGLTSVTIGNSVTVIGSNAFEDCRGLRA